MCTEPRATSRSNLNRKVTPPSKIVDTKRENYEYECATCMKVYECVLFIVTGAFISGIWNSGYFNLSKEIVGILIDSEPCSAL